MKTTHKHGLVQMQILMFSLHYEAKGVRKSSLVKVPPGLFKLQIRLCLLLWPQAGIILDRSSVDLSTERRVGWTFISALAFPPKMQKYHQPQWSIWLSLGGPAARGFPGHHFYFTLSVSHFNLWWGSSRVEAGECQREGGSDHLCASTLLTKHASDHFSPISSLVLLQ